MYPPYTPCIPLAYIPLYSHRSPDSHCIPLYTPCIPLNTLIYPCIPPQVTCYSSNMQESADRVSQCVKDLRMKLNPAKCKEMLVCFQRSLPDIPNILIEDKQPERVSTYKLLGVHISNDLTWNNHIDYLSKKAAKRIYFIRQLKRAGVAVRERFHIYVASIRSVIEYAAPVWFFSAPAYLIGQLEAIQRRVLKIILPEYKYSDALHTASIPTVHARLQSISMNYFKGMANKKHKLHHLFPKLYCNSYSTRSQVIGTLSYLVVALGEQQILS